MNSLESVVRHFAVRRAWGVVLFSEAPAFEHARTRTFVGMVVAALLAVGAFGPSPAAAQGDTGGVALFDGADFSGLGTMTHSSVPDLAQFDPGWAGRISSLRVLDGVAVAAYTQPDYRGACETFTSQDRWLGDNAIGNDAIRSVKLGFTCFGPVPGQVIVTDVAVVTGTNGGVGCPAGYSRKNQDLNQGAGGDYVYLCVKWGPRTRQEAIDGVEVVSDFDLSLLRFYSCTDAGERLIEVDLNSGVSNSRYVMLCLSTVTSPDPVRAIQDLDFVVSDDDLKCAPPFNCTSHDERIDEACEHKLGTSATFGAADGDLTDLNQNAGGKYIYLCTKRVDDYVPITHVNHGPPTITRIARTAANAAGWNSTAVTVTWRCTAGSTPLTSPELVTRTVSGDGAHQSAVGACADLAGHEVTDTVGDINIDTTPPEIMLLSRTPANGAGWNRDDVTVSWSCADGLSGAVENKVRSVVHGEGANRKAIAMCRDRAGNERSGEEGGINIDRTSPDLTLVSRTPPPTEGWNSTDVSLVWRCDDSLAGVDAGHRTVTATATGEGSDLTATATCPDRAGNTDTDHQPVRIDRTPPELHATATTSDGEPYTAGAWTRYDVTVTFTCNDPLSGVVNATAPSTISSNGAGQSAAGTCTDKAGNQATETFTGVNIDKIAPEIVATRTPEPNAAGWNNTPVTARFACSDGLSGIAACTEPVTVSAEGAGQSATGTAVDRAGNTASARVEDINIDSSAPAVTCAVEPSSLWPPNHQLVPVDVTVELTDGRSGAAGFALVSVTSSEPDDAGGDGSTTDDIIGFDIGTPDTHGSLRAERAGNGPGRTYTLTYRGSDSAGNSATCQAHVHVAHDQA